MGKVSVLVPALQFDCYSEVCPVLFCALPQSKKKKQQARLVKMVRHLVIFLYLLQALRF